LWSQQRTVGKENDTLTIERGKLNGSSEGGQRQATGRLLAQIITYRKDKAVRVDRRRAWEEMMRETAPKGKRLLTPLSHNQTGHTNTNRNWE